MGKTPNTDALGHPGAKGTGASGRDSGIAGKGGNPGVKHPGNGGTHSASNIAPLTTRDPQATAGQTARNTKQYNTVIGDSDIRNEKATRGAKNAGSGKGMAARPR